MPLEEPPEKAKNSQAMVATWADGTRHEIPEFTVAAFRKLQVEDADRAQQQQQKAETFWTGTHIKSHHALKVFVKQDRQVLYVLYEQGRQILQCRPSAFSDEKIAQQLIVDIAQRFAKDELAKTQLKDVRNAEMKKMGVKTKKKTQAA